MISIDIVNNYYLIMNRIYYLSTISNFGAKLISLYLFCAKNNGKLIYNLQFYGFYPRFLKEWLYSDE